MGAADSKSLKPTVFETIPKTTERVLIVTERETNRCDNNKYMPSFDPLYGFPNGRKKRESKVSWEDMERANMPYKYRDYCAHHYMDMMHCRRKKWPFFMLCKPIAIEYEHCEFEDFKLSMMEWERERRLLERAQRKRLAKEKSESEMLD